VIAGVFPALTGVLLVADLKQPTALPLHADPGQHRSVAGQGRVRPRRSPWCGAWFLAGSLDRADGPLKVLASPVSARAGTAGYTAFLFGQCEGRDLWQTPLLLPMLLAQAVVAGGAAYRAARPLHGRPRAHGDPVGAARWRRRRGAVDPSS
jgi:hypothetical protein